MKRLTAMLASKNWQQQLALASDKWPGTEFDRIFRATEQVKALGVENNFSELIEKIYVFIGQQLVETIDVRGSQGLHDMAEAWNKWKKHRSSPNKIRTALLLEAGSQRKTSVRAVMAHLKRKRIPTNQNTPRTIRRMAKRLNIRLARG